MNLDTVRQSAAKALWSLVRLVDSEYAKDVESLKLELDAIVEDRDNLRDMLVRVSGPEQPAGEPRGALIQTPEDDPSRQ